MSNDEDLKKELVDTFFRMRNGSVVQRFVKGSCQRAGHNLPDMAVLRAIACNTEESDSNMSIADLQNLLHISKAAVSMMLSKLENGGYIVRSIDVRNRRRIIITLTEKGRNEVAIGELHFKRMMDEVINRFGIDEMREFLSSFQRFVKIMHQIKDEFNSVGGGDA